MTMIFEGAGRGLLGSLNQCHDLRVLGVPYRWDGTATIPTWSGGSYATEFWPASRCGFAGDCGTDFGMLAVAQYEPFEAMAAGSSSRLGFVGVACDRYGSPVAGADLKLFRASTHELVHTTTSGADGSYLLQTWYYPDAHYVVAHKTGSPDIAGATVATLVGA